MSPMEATVDPPSPGSRLDADHPDNGVLIPCLFTPWTATMSIARTIRPGSAGGPRRTPGDTRAARFGRRKLGYHQFAEDDGAGLAQRRGTRRISPGAAADKQRRTLLRRHVDSFDDVLDTERNAVDGGRRQTLAPARGGRSAATLAQQC